jgi:hypothetical protein
VSETVPELPDECWPVDHSCTPDWGTLYDQTVRDRADALAIQTLRTLTGFRVGGCPVMLRPCRRSCEIPTYMTFPLMGSWGAGTGGWWPVLVGGQWLNIGCGGCGRYDGCNCGRLCEILFTFDISSLAVTGNVWIDGGVLDPSAYRVDNGNRLTRIDGECWPECQDLTKPVTEDGTFGVEVFSGIPVDGLGAYAAGVLAAEYAKACNGDTCALPAGVTSIVRQGVSLQIASEGGAFPGGLTGIRVVDSFIRRWNPHALVEAPMVWSPDVRHPRAHNV